MKRDLFSFLLPCEQPDAFEKASSDTEPRCATCSGYLRDVEITCEACLNADRPMKRLRHLYRKVHEDNITCKLRHCKCLKEEENDASATAFEIKVIDAPSDEARGSCDIGFGEFQMAEDLEGPPETVASGFAEPDELESATQAAVASALSYVANQQSLNTEQVRFPSETR